MPQWTVGQLRAELVGLPDDTPLVIDVPIGDSAGIRRHLLVGAGYGPDIDPDEGLFGGQEFPLVASGLRRATPRLDVAWPSQDAPAVTDQGIDPDSAAP